MVRLLSILALIVSCFAAGAEVPPLTGEQVDLLATAYDGRNHEEPAFMALLANTSVWTRDVGDAAIRLTPNLDAMLAEPANYRGDLCRLEGRLLEVESLNQPYLGIDAWWIRDGDGVPVLVYVDQRPALIRMGIGARIEIDARFYKTYEDTERGEGATHTYPVFVGAFPRPKMAAADPWIDQLAYAIPVVVLGAVFLVVFMIARGKRGGRNGRSGRSGAPGSSRASPTSGGGGLRHLSGDAGEMDDDLALSDDPAAALQELKRRHADDSS